MGRPAAKKASAPRVVVARPGDKLAEDADIAWRPNSDKQIIALQRTEFEIFFGGAKGGGKSFCGIGWLISGNPLPDGADYKPIDISYINSPLYRGLVLRKNHIALKEWIEEAKIVYGKLGADYVDDEFRFPSGALIRTGHLADESAYERYFGQQVHRIFIDELTFIPKAEIYRKILFTPRSTVPGIRPQLFLTGNPGGPGTRWVKDRFISPRARNGQIVTPLTPMGETYYNPILKRNVQITRIYIPSRVTDNADIVEKDPMYVTRLMMGSAAERRAYIDGDWDALAGQFFDTFRPKGPLAGEEKYPNANHVVRTGSVELLPYWHRWIGMDWGFSHESAVFWGCQHPNSQIHIYRELVVSKVGAEELGALIARESIGDLAGLPDHHMTINLSPDAFARRDDVNTIAEQLANGIARVLGPKSVFLVDFTEQERTMPDAMAWESLNKRRAMSNQTSITIERANNERVAGWMLMREYLRFKPIMSISHTEIDWNIVWDLQAKSGVMASMEYINSIAKQRGEVLPKLQIWDCCPKAIRGISEAQFDEKRPEDVLKNDADNEIDSLRYLMMSASGHQSAKPKQYVITDRVAELPAGASAHSRFMAAQKAADDYDKQHNKARGFMIPRATGRHRRTMVQ